MSSWFDKRESRPVVEWPNGRDWRCQGQIVDGNRHYGCGHSYPEDTPATTGDCPECGGPMTRTVVQQ